MKIDHLFIFSNDQGEIANQLVDFGLQEGSSRTHKGQGTKNRKFYFQNFYLEIVWVCNQEEIRSEQTKVCGLWKRAYFEQTNSSPFGLCLVNNEASQELFENAFIYQPDYFPEGLSMSVLSNEEQSSLPWTFRLPFCNEFDSEPTEHENGLQKLSKACFEHTGSGESQFLECFDPKGQITFQKSDRSWLHLQFDEGKQGKRKDFKELRLSIEY